MKTKPRTNLSRRQFLAVTGMAVAAPTFIPASALGRDGKPAPSERITVGAIGCGWQGGSNMGGFLNHANCRVVAVCDVDKNHLQGAKETVDKHYKNSDCKTYSDYRELCARKDIDAVMIALPDHWHALAAVEAAQQGKDIYGEKPLARTIVEQQAIVKAVQKNKRIWQTGSWQRSERHFHYAAERVRSRL